MAKVTSKLQVTLPKALAELYGIQPGDEIEWSAAGDAIRVVPVKGTCKPGPATREQRLMLFDQATRRLQARAAQQPAGTGDSPTFKRGWTREELYDRG